MLSRHFPGLFLGTMLGVSIAIAHSVSAERDESSKKNDFPFEGLHTFTEVFTRIKENYVEEVSDEVLLENAIHGMLSGLDPHSTYLGPDAFKELQVGTSGQFGGLGIEVSMEDGFVKVIAPIDDTPAQRAGIKAGDLIVRLDKTPVKGMTLMDAVKIMRGKPKTDITLTIVREGEIKPLRIVITRAIIKVKSIKSRILEPDYAYVRITQFQARTTRDLHKMLNKLKKENGDKLKGLVLDLRNNPGGVLNAAVGVADTFLKKGLIVYTEGRISDSDLKFKARPKDLIANTPLVILVNGGSASASEIVAGALQDHKRAIIMGTKTFGKGSVQTIQPMSNHAALKITTARYFTPSGRSIQAEGIQPDIVLSKVEIASIKTGEETRGITEADLVGHLDNGNGDSHSKDKADGGKDNNKPAKKEKEEIPLAKSDYALYEALNLLKGLNVVQTLSR